MAGGKLGGDPHPVDRHVGRRVAEKRISMGLSQTDVGRALGLTFQQVQKYEKGANRISASKLWDLAILFDLDPNAFFEGLERSPRLGDNATCEQDGPTTRQTVEMARIALRLSRRQQALVLDLMKTMASAPASIA